ncbi:hornerin-like isoform X1 [Diabrotica virgifera virgifera]|uniref:Hornerin-like n=1 Tax=Diabrotica virgifera virgifera TaxID=50390 RepID=A0ABM5L7G8_DIAVI|nr:hornerin-like isoform X1 [Diabrotica virgifera virgifera]
MMFFRLTRLLFIIATTWAICLPDPPNLSRQELRDLKHSLEEYISSFSQKKLEHDETSSMNSGRYVRNRYDQTGGLPMESSDVVKQEESMGTSSMNNGKYGRNRYHHSGGLPIESSDVVTEGDIRTSSMNKGKYGRNRYQPGGMMTYPVDSSGIGMQEGGMGISSMNDAKYRWNGYYQPGGMMTYPLEFPGIGMEEELLNYVPYSDQEIYYDNYGPNMYDNGMNVEFLPVPPMPYLPNRFSPNLPVSTEENHMSNEYVSSEEQKSIDNMFNKTPRSDKNYRVTKTETYYPDRSIQTDSNAECNVNCYTHAPVLTNSLYGKDNAYGRAWQQMYAPGFLEKINGYDLVRNQNGVGNIFELQDLSNRYIAELQAMYGTDTWRILQEMYSPEYLVYLQRLYGPEFFNRLSLQSNSNNYDFLRSNGAQRGGYWQLLFRPEYGFYGMDEHIDEYLSFLRQNYPMLYFRYMQNPELFYQQIPFPWFNRPYFPNVPNTPIYNGGGPKKPPIDSRFSAKNKTEEEVKEKETVHTEETKNVQKVDDLTEVLDEDEDEDEDEEDTIDIGQRFDDNRKNKGKHRGTNKKHNEKDKTETTKDVTVVEVEKTTETKSKGTKDTGGEETVVHSVVEKKDNVVIEGSNGTTNGNSGSNTAGGIESRNDYGEGSVITNTIERHPQHLTLTINIPSETVSKKVEVTHPAGYEYSQSKYQESHSEQHNNKNGGHGHKSGSHAGGHAKKGEFGYEESQWEENSSSSENKQGGASGHSRHNIKHKIVHHKSSTSGQHSGGSGVGEDNDEYETSGSENGGSNHGHRITKYRKVVHHTSSKHGQHSGASGVGEDNDEYETSGSENGGSNHGHRITKYRKVVHHTSSKNGQHSGASGVGKNNDEYETSGSENGGSSHGHRITKYKKVVHHTSSKSGQHSAGSGGSFDLEESNGSSKHHGKGQGHSNKGGYKVGYRISTGGSSEDKSGSGHTQNSNHGRRVVHKHVVHRHNGGNFSHGVHRNNSHHHGNSTGEDYEYEFETEYEDMTGGGGSMNKTVGGGGRSKGHWYKVGNRYSTGGGSSGSSGYKNGAGHKSGHRVVHKHVIHRHNGGNFSHGVHRNNSHHHGNSTGEDYEYEFETEYEDMTGGGGSMNKTVGGGGGSKGHWYKVGNRYSTHGGSSGSSGYKNGSGHKSGHRVVHKHVIHRHNGGNFSHGVHRNNSHHHGNSTGEDYEYEFETEYEDMSGGGGSMNKTVGGGGGSKGHWSKVGNRYSTHGGSSGSSGYKNGSGHKSGHRVVHRHVIHGHKGGNFSHGIHRNNSHHHGNSTGEDYDYEYEYEEITEGGDSNNKTIGGGGGAKKHWSKVGNRFSSGGQSSGSSGHKNSSGRRVVHKHVVHGHKGGNSSHGFNMSGNASHKHGNSSEGEDYEYETEYEEIFGDESSGNSTMGGIPGNNSKISVSNKNGVKYVVKEEVIPSVHTISVDIPADLWTSGSGTQTINGGPTVEIKTETGAPQTNNIIEVSKDPFISHPPAVVVEEKQSNDIFSSILDKAKGVVNNMENAIIGGP